jgi:hypothetical protein
VHLLIDEYVGLVTIDASTWRAGYVRKRVLRHCDAEDMYANPIERGHWRGRPVVVKMRAHLPGRDQIDVELALVPRLPEARRHHCCLPFACVLGGNNSEEEEEESGVQAIVYDVFDTDARAWMRPLWHQKTRVSSQLVWFLLQQGLDALAYLERQGVVHGDVAGRNLLLGSNGTCMHLGDFGVARICASSSAPSDSDAKALVVCAYGWMANGLTTHEFFEQATKRPGEDAHMTLIHLLFTMVQDAPSTSASDLLALLHR